MPRYVKCPRCDLNYIDADTQEYCDICMAELGAKHRFIDFDDETLSDYDYVPDTNGVCSMCGKAIPAGETMCEACKEKYGFGDDEVESDESAETEEGEEGEDDEWKSYLDDAEVELSEEEKSLKEELEAEYGSEDEYDDEEEEEEAEEEEEVGYTMNLEDFDDDDDYPDDFDDEDDDDKDF